MSSPFRILEILTCSLAGFLPYMLLMVYPFRDRLRFSSSLTALFTALMAVIRIGCDLAAGLGILSNPALALLISLAAQTLFGLLVIQAPAGKTLFQALTTAELAVLVSAATKALETLLFPAQAAEFCRWSYLLLMLVVEAPVLICYFLYLLRPMEDTLCSDGSSAWKTLWLVPGVAAAAGYCMMLLKLAPWLTAVLMVVLCVGGFGLTLVLYRKAGISAAPRAEKAPKPAVQKPAFQMVREIPVAHRDSAPPSQLQILQYSSLMERVAESERMHQELRRHIDTMAYNLNHKELDKLRTHFTVLQTQFPTESPVSYCENTALNPILVYFVQQAGYCGVNMAVDIKLPRQTPVSNEDLATLLGNLLDNAMDACKNQKSTDRRIRAASTLTAHTLHLTVENTYELPIRKDAKGRYLSTKHPGCGIGLEVCKQIAARYHGAVELSDANGLFKAEITLNF